MYPSSVFSPYFVIQSIVMKDLGEYKMFTLRNGC